MTRWFLLLSVACASTHRVDGAPCELAERYATCPECFEGDVTCSIDGFSAREPSCEDCEALAALLRNMCEAGVEEVRGDVTCR